MSSVYWRQYGFVTNEGVFVGEKPNKNEFIINPMFKVVDCKTWNKFNSLFQCNMFLAWHTCHDYGVHWLVVVCNNKKKEYYVSTMSLLKYEQLTTFSSKANSIINLIKKSSVSFQLWFHITFCVALVWKRKFWLENYSLLIDSPYKK